MQKVAKHDAITRLVACLLGFGLSSHAIAVLPAYQEGYAYVETPGNFLSSTTQLYGGDVSCSGVAISPTLVLTAAHCLTPSSMVQVQSWAGFDLYVPKAEHRVGVAQGISPIATSFFGDPKPTSSTTAFGFMRALAIVPAGIGGPDLALIKVTERYNPTRYEPFQSASLMQPGMVLEETNPAQGIQVSSGNVIAGARVEGYSQGDGLLGHRPKQLSGGSVLVTPAPHSYGNRPDEKSPGWKNMGFVQDENLAKSYLETPTNVSGAMGNTYRNYQAAVVPGDSGGPLYASIKGSLETTVIGITNTSTSKQEYQGPGKIQWTSVSESYALIDSMRNVLDKIPEAGTTRQYGYIPQGVDQDGDSLINYFSVFVPYAAGMQYFDPRAGMSEELTVDGATEGIVALDLGELASHGLSIQTRDAQGKLIDAAYLLSDGGVVQFSTPFKFLRLEGLNVSVGEDIVLGMRFSTFTMGVVDVTWKNVGVLSAVPEPSAFALAVAGLAFLGFSNRRM